jgi:hypothetical protein
MRQYVCGESFGTKEKLGWFLLLLLLLLDERPGGLVISFPAEES